jgi:hypothetical protein
MSHRRYVKSISGLKEFVHKAEAQIAQQRAKRLEGVKESDLEDYDEDATGALEDEWETPGETAGGVRSDMLRLQSARGDLEYDPNDMSKYQKPLTRMKTQGGNNNNSMMPR